MTKIQPLDLRAVEALLDRGQGMRVAPTGREATLTQAVVVLLAHCRTLRAALLNCSRELGQRLPEDWDAARKEATTVLAQAIDK